MKLAFLISAYTDAPQLKRLVMSLPDDADIFVHVDKNSDIEPFKAELATCNRVHFLIKRISVTWGSFRQVEFQMALIEEALLSATPFKYLVMLSGQDYAIFSKEHITKFFEEANDKEFICGIDLTTQNEAAEIYKEYRLFANYKLQNGSLLSKIRVALRKTLAFVGVRKPLKIKADKTYNLYKGADYWAITPKLAEYILSEFKTNKILVNYFKNSFAPSETFPQTVAFNSPKWRSKCIEFHTTWPGMAALTPLTYIYYHPIIKILTEEDYDNIISSGKMFARKLMSGKSDKLVMILHDQRDVNNKHIHIDEQ